MVNPALIAQVGKVELLTDAACTKTNELLKKRIISNVFQQARSEERRVGKECRL